MVFKLISDGGYNIICSRCGAPPNTCFSGCDAAVGNLGFTKASETLFQTVAYYIPSNVTWADLATYASEAAFDLYSDCEAFPKYHATGEQYVVDKAFTAIGYPRTTAAVRCP